MNNFEVLEKLESDLIKSMIAVNVSFETLENGELKDRLKAVLSEMNGALRRTEEELFPYYEGRD